MERMLEGAEAVVSRARHCWLMTSSREGRIHARPMGQVISSRSPTDWTLSFLADARSEKVRDIDAAQGVRLTFECEEDAFVSVSGLATVISDPAAVAQRWLPAYDCHFATAADTIHARFIDIRIDEIRLWIRGLTSEPFGSASVTLRRAAKGDWQVQSVDEIAGGVR
jgi:general stress protein 26